MPFLDFTSADVMVGFDSAIAYYFLKVDGSVSEKTPKSYHAIQTNLQASSFLVAYAQIVRRAWRGNAPGPLPKSSAQISVTRQDRHHPTSRRLARFRR